VRGYETAGFDVTVVTRPEKPSLSCGAAVTTVLSRFVMIVTTSGVGVTTVTSRDITDVTGLTWGKGAW
jgi:hypothetical protein